MGKNILFLVQETFETGVARAAANLSTHLPDEDNHHYIVAYHAKRIDFDFRGHIIDLQTIESKHPAGKLLTLWRRIRIIRKIKKDKQIDVAISFQLSANLINILTRRKERIIISIRNALTERLEGFYGKLYRTIIKHLFQRADLIVPVSRHISNDLQEHFNIDPTNINVITNHYEIKTIRKQAAAPIAKTHHHLFDGPVVVTSGRLSEQKGQWHLLRAFKNVKMMIPDVTLVILGAGKLEPYLTQLARDLAIQDDVHLLGFRDNPFRYVQRANVFVLPSLYEGFPNVLCEAMACRTPVIAADCPSGPREILTTSIPLEQKPVEHLTYAEYGILLPVCDGIMHEADVPLQPEEKHLSDAIITMLDNHALADAYSHLALKRIQDFSKETVIGKWTDAVSPENQERPAKQSRKV
ncbi:glycosyl transferase [Lentibacillus kapialis]|uniref:Glycosyl transferase n=1 Tax=Lentibacillus kapialis TaxID=340214 RepID=A0A917Q0V5_9BACI|nr:glycosyltransferase [Lentibacillus kapialis]GGK05798.1 glycosyl transferase [Lentibacillus kapialis]